jgi:hypothetical protein
MEVFVYYEEFRIASREGPGCLPQAHLTECQPSAALNAPVCSHYPSAPELLVFSSRVGWPKRRRSSRSRPGIGLVPDGGLLQNLAVTSELRLLVVLHRGLLQPRFAPVFQVRCAENRLRPPHAPVPRLPKTTLPAGDVLSCRRAASYGPEDRLAHHAAGRPPCCVSQRSGPRPLQ